jgi:hypothetical protein
MLTFEHQGPGGLLRAESPFVLPGWGNGGWGFLQWGGGAGVLAAIPSRPLRFDSRKRMGGLNLKRGHTEAVPIEFRDNGTLLDLTGVTAIQLRVERVGDGIEEIERDIDLADIDLPAGNGLLRFLVTENQNAGAFRAEVKITNANTTIRRLPNLGWVFWTIRSELHA